MQIRTFEDIDIDDAAVYRSIWKISSGFSTLLCLEHAIEDAERTADMITLGRLFISNPDLAHRIINNYLLSPIDYGTFNAHEARGYTDYPYSTVHLQYGTNFIK
ncbi:hypothetical protein BD408DRAFT_470078 [Parasitella parasitica]|nr:hypothetical protein BD408DRAFT_470078 [Parasitella parasitica]